MKKDKEYIIKYKGLKDGVHNFSYLIDSCFFAMIEDSMYNDGNIKVELSLNKGFNILTLDFCLKGYVSSVCDNCLEPINVPFENSERIYVKFGDKYEEMSDESLMIPHSEHEIDIRKMLYDIIVTSLPMRHLHEYDKKGNNKCNPDMIKILNEYSKNNSIDSTHKQSDPRWEGLKKLIDN